MARLLENLHPFIRYFVARQRKINYEEFYKTYDPYKDFLRMKKLGLFQSCKADD